MPNQFCLWGQSYNLAVTFLSVPVASATNLANQLARSVPKVVRANLTNHVGSFVWVSNKSEILWQGLPFILPRLHPISDGGLEYLVAEILPMQPKKTSPPAELFHEFMNRTNLVYYDWEITGERLPHATQLHQLYNIINEWQIPGTNVPTQKWLLVAGPHLGNTVTELTVASPKELLLVRKSHLGFTGFELASLARWIESPGFPLGYEPPPLLRPTRKPGSHTPTNSAVNPTSSPPKKL